MNDFGLGLQVTAWGMGLVFGTLIIVALVIWALDKVFRPKPEAEEEAEAPVALGAEAAPPPSGPSRSNEAAAIALALALEWQRAKPRATTTATAAQPFLAPLGDEDVVGEVVTVATFDAGPGLWKGHGRMTSTI